jgi:hypothetical protein
VDIILKALKEGDIVLTAASRTYALRKYTGGDP